MTKKIMWVLFVALTLAQTALFAAALLKYVSLGTLNFTLFCLLCLINLAAFGEICLRPEEKKKP